SIGCKSLAGVCLSQLSVGLDWAACEELSIGCSLRRRKKKGCLAVRLFQRRKKGCCSAAKKKGCLRRASK
ncbi:MAG: hypothetical protein ABJ331_20355, partial [Marinobacter sp.]|uniref:hypothetical protein n=1 Tax=Marinobacter sp. TaxID=50741 RepID=UPI003296F62B